jgi:hypothetical protein
MTGSRIVLAILATFALLTFAGGAVVLAADPQDKFGSSNTALISNVSGERALGEKQLPTKAVAPCTLATYAYSGSYSGQRLRLIERQPSASNTAKSRIFRSRWKHVSSNYSIRQDKGSQQIFDVYLPSYASHMQLLHYLVWFEVCRPANFT